ncbi:response regulator transcription factor [Rhizosaccharibacter radicis]|uniref:Response regulator transcription factor n=1 Tax=Rhizosaccharibacter radicis TaxID=2782605 RepID=A0ABT1W182_9PROT|nr:response regulator transcription factor [Acetobacteraceae bacterium KSS12]
MNNSMSDENPPSRILVVEDDPGMRMLILRVLQGSGYSVRGAQDGREMWEALSSAPFDLVILDVMLPGTNGLDLCRALRRDSHVPVIIVSARGEELDRVLGLELGADDYVPKPFGQKELLARVRAVLRRGTVAPARQNGSERRESLSFAGWLLDLRRRELTDPDGAAVELSGAEHDLLASFLENPQRVIGRDRLLELSRTRLGDVSDRSVDVLVSRLRRKLGSDSENLIRTVRGLGYIFTADVERV